MLNLILFFFPIIFLIQENNDCSINSDRTQLFQNRNHDVDHSFEIMKIDSIENVYLIYAKRHDSLIKIVSAKEKESDCQKIFIRGKYELKISSIVYPIPGKRHIAGVKFNNTIIRMEGGNVTWDLFVSENLKGLCFLPSIHDVCKD